MFIGLVIRIFSVPDFPFRSWWGDSLTLSRAVR